MTSLTDAMTRPSESITEAIGKSSLGLSTSNRGDWMQTYSGRVFYPSHPRPEDIAIEDIAHHLSMLCRFAGATRSFYSVAQHCVIVSQSVPAEHAKWGLMHDASEAYINDLIRPIKTQLPLFKEIETRIEKAIAERFDLPRPIPPCIKDADLRALATERRDLLAPCAKPWILTEQVIPFAGTIRPMSSDAAEAAFLNTFNLLTYGR